MRQFMLRAGTFFLLSFFFTLSVYAAENFTIDPKHSYVLWKISHFDFSEQTGKWYAEGSLQIDKAHPQNSKVNAVINVGDFITGIPKLDEHLKKAEFFDVEKFPKATFVSDKITITGKDTAKVQGMLTLHGVSKPVVLNVTLRKTGMSPVTNKETAGFTATTHLKRSDYGMRTYLPGLGDDVNIIIEVEAYKDGKK